MLRRSHVAVLALLVAGSLVSCDTLKARRRASEAASLYRDGKLAEAAEVYSEAEKLDPNIAAIHLNLGFAYLTLFNQGAKPDEAKRLGQRAVEEFRAYIAAKPKDPRGRQYLLQTFVDTRRYEDAVEFLRPETEGPKPSIEAISLLAQIAAKLGRFEDSLGWYERRVAVTPNETEGYDGLGVLIWDYLHNYKNVVGEKRIKYADRGIEALKKSIELKPFPPEPYTYVNLLYRERAAAHECVISDGGVVLVGATPDGGVTDAGTAMLGGCDLERADLLQAKKYFDIAIDKYKSRAAATPAAAAATTTKDGKDQKPAPAPKGGSK